MSPTVAFLFQIGNTISDNYSTTTAKAHMDVTRINLMKETTNRLISDRTTELREFSLASSIEEYNCSTSTNEDSSAKPPKKEENNGEMNLFDVVDSTNCQDKDPVVVHDSEDDDAMSMDTDAAFDNLCSLSVFSDTSSIGGEEVLVSDAGFDGSHPISTESHDIIRDQIASCNSAEDMRNCVVQSSCHLTEVTAMDDDSDVATSSVLLDLPQESKLSNSTASFSALQLTHAPLWGCRSICGKRPEMEDAFSIVPQFSKALHHMLSSGCIFEESVQTPSHIAFPFFGVYDGHGGAQVANYCRDRLHSALLEELENVQDLKTYNSSNWQVLWKDSFTKCFLKVDDEIGGKIKRVGDGATDLDGNFEPVAPETVGTTAVVAVLSSSHIIVANCGDSRAVLCRGKKPVPLSIDHKPDREDEYARIEASGGKVIQWNGYRVFGVLAMSRSIGDRYLKPWIIPEPEVMFVPRTKEDECIILASDGLWDVMTNEEVCDIARKRILLWHKRNGVTHYTEGTGQVDSAAQAAAECLCKCALQKGSKDNITVIVVDLKGPRKYKSKTREKVPQ